MATATAPATRPTHAPLPRPALVPTLIVVTLALLAVTGLALGSAITNRAEAPAAPANAVVSAIPAVTTPPLPAGTPVEPEGALERVASHQARRVTATGWALGGTVGAPLAVEFTSDGQLLSTVTPATPRPEVGQRHPGAGLDHGFNHTFAMVPGRHLICATAVTDTGERLELGCSVATVGR